MSQKKIKNPIFVPTTYNHRYICIRSGSFMNHAIYINSNYREKTTKYIYPDLGIRVCLKRK